MSGLQGASGPVRKRRRGRPPNPALRAAKHARMLRTAMELFNLRGYEHVTVERIAQAAGQSKGAFYWYFEDKEDCLRQIIDNVSGKIDAMAEAELGKGQTAGDKLLQLTDLSRWRNGELSSFVMLFDSMIFSRSSTVRELGVEAVRRIYHSLFGRLKVLGPAAAREGGWTNARIKAFDFDHWALLLLASYDGLFEFINQEYFKGLPDSKRATKAIHAAFVQPLIGSRLKEKSAP